MLRRTFAVLVLSVVAAVAASQCFAATVQLELVKDPAAVGCTGCTLSGPNTYQIFAHATGADNFGIAGYSIPVLNVSSLLHRAPRVSTVEDMDGNTAPAGFSNFRTNNNQTVITGGFNFGATQDVFTPTTYLMKGYGISAGSFEAALPAGTTKSGVIQPDWGGRLLLAEGAYVTGSVPTIDFQSVDLSVNVFGSANDFSLAAATVGPFEPSGVAPVVADLSYVSNVLNEVVNLKPVDSAPGTAPVTWSALSGPTYTPMFGALPGAPGLALAPTWDPNTQQFSWNIAGSTRGRYVWTGTAGNTTGTDGYSLTVDVTVVPEPATLSLIGLAVFGCIGLIRRR